jgi:hypothetical protein
MEETVSTTTGKVAHYELTGASNWPAYKQRTEGYAFATSAIGLSVLNGTHLTALPNHRQNLLLVPILLSVMTTRKS